MQITEFLSKTLWEKLRAESAVTSQHRIAVSYVTDVECLNLQQGDLLVIDASDKTIASGGTSAAAVESLLRKKVDIKSLANLHAKIYVFDHRCAVVGSANLSPNSMTRLHEAAILSRDQVIVWQAADQVEKYASRGVRINQAFLERIKEIEVQRPAHEPSRETLSGGIAPALWRLAEVPPENSALMRAYFVALISLQIGHLTADVRFRLWPSKTGGKANFSRHIKNGRLREDGGEYCLTDEGVKYFSSPAEAPDLELSAQFTKALQTGVEADLPNGLTDASMISF